MPNRPTPRDPKVRCQLKPVALRQPSVADVEVGNFVFEVGGFAEAEANLVDARDVDHPDAVPGREVVHGLGVERVHDRHAAETHVFGEQIQEASSRRHDPGSLPGVDRPFENGAGAGEAERGPPAKRLAIALALGHLQHARRAVDVGCRIPTGEEGDILQELGIEQAHGAARRGKVRERVDVGNLDVVHHEQVLEGAAAAHDDVVAKVVGADHDARQGLHVARHVLQGGGALEDLARLHQEPRVLDGLGRLERRRGHRDRLLEVLHRGQRDFYGAVLPGADVHQVAGEGQAGEGQNLQPISARAQVADAKHAAGVAGGARGGVEGAHAHAAGRLAGPVHHDAPDGAHAGGVLCQGRRRRQAQDGGGDHE